MKAGGAGYKAMGLFHGLAEVYFHSGIIKKWDLCAAEGIVKSTCYGKFTTLDGSKIDYRYEFHIHEPKKYCSAIVECHIVECQTIVECPGFRPW